MADGTDGSGVQRSEVEAQLRAIRSAPEFAHTPRLQALLEYLTTATLDGTGDRLKGYAIAVDVFGRDSSFDSNTDSIVRVQVGRLRALLDEYYSGTGSRAPIRIALQKGDYRPTFERRIAAPPVDSLVAQKRGPITLAVLPFSDLSGQSEALVNGIAEGLTVATARNKAFTVTSVSAAAGLAGVEEISRAARERGVLYVLRGSLQAEANRVRVTAQLLDTKREVIAWTTSFERSDDTALAIISETIGAIEPELRYRLVELAAEAFENSGEETPWALYLRATWSPAGVSTLVAEQRRVALLRRALDADPDFGQAHSLIAERLAFLANADPPSDTPNLREEALRHVVRAMDLAGDDAAVVFNVALYYWYSGNITEAVSSAERTLELNPLHPAARFVAKVFPYTAREVPQAVIEALKAYDANLAPDQPVRWGTLTWLNALYLNNRDFVAAAEAGRQAHKIFVTPDSLFSYAAALVQTGKVDAARELVRAQRTNWPNLSIRHFADVVIPRRCGHEPGAAALTALYREVADAIEEAAQQPYALVEAPQLPSSAAVASIFRMRFAFIALVAGLAALVALVTLFGWKPEVIGTVPTPQATAPVLYVSRYKTLAADKFSQQLSEGIQIELIDQLSRFRDVRVLALDTVHGVSAEDAARKTHGANFILSGTIQNDAGKVRVVSSLADARSGAIVWSNSADAPSDSAAAVMELQSKLASGVATQLGQPYGVIQEHMRQTMADRRDVAFDDYACVLDAYHYTRAKNASEHARVRDCLELATRRSPSFANAWALLSWVYGDEARYGFNVRPGSPSPYQRAERAAVQAVRANPNNSTAHLYLSVARFYLGEDESAHASAERSLQLNPNNSEALATYGYQIGLVETSKRGREMLERAVALNPGHPPWYQQGLAIHALREGDAKAALKHAQQGVEDGDVLSRLALATALRLNGEVPSAETMLQAIERDHPEIKRDSVAFLRERRIPDDLGKLLLGERFGRR
jgi:TolB-like protein